MRDLWRIESPDGLGVGSTVTLNGVPLDSVVSATINVDVDGVVSATLEVHNVEVVIGALKLDSVT